MGGHRLSESRHRWLALAQHLVFPSRERALLLLAVELLALVLDLPVPVHLVIALVAHVLASVLP